MTEAEWQECTDPLKMLEFLKGRASQRKLRLFACACCRCTRLVVSGENIKALEVAESFADGLVKDRERSAARNARGVSSLIQNTTIRSYFIKTAAKCAAGARHLVAHARSFGRPEATDLHEQLAIYRAGIHAERAAQSVLIRDLFGNSFRALTMAPSWLAWQGGLIRQLAEAAYQERQLPSGHLDLSRLAVLADALEEAGCQVEEILGHLRSPGPHVRGCHLLDLLLAKE
jgi:hypothetical protein